MLSALSSTMKKRLPTLHEFSKQCLRQSKLPVPKMLLGRPVWTHSRLLNTRLTEPHVMKWIADRLHPCNIFFRRWRSSRLDVHGWRPASREPRQSCRL